jgi:dextranase
MRGNLRRALVLRRWFLQLLLVTILIGCTTLPETQESENREISPTMETPMTGSLEITDIQIDQAYYRPGDIISVLVHLQSQSEGSFDVQLIVTVKHLVETIERIEKTIEIPEGVSSFKLTYTPPLTTPRGYGFDLCFETKSGNQLACKSIAFDVLERWSQTPRYGFLTDYSPNRDDVKETMEDLSRYYINGLQFYDWMYRHDQFLTDEDPYRDPLNRLLSRDTVEELISAAHEHNIAAMPYTAIYAASIPFYEAHPDWALYQANGEPYRLGENFLIYMDPRPESPWVEHLLNQFDQVLDALEFDGIHLDQYGDPKTAQDAHGKRFALDVPLAATIDLTKELVQSHQVDGSVVFNAVNNWPIETVAPSSQDFVYIEVWPPHIWYQDLHRLIVEAQELSEGKPVVLAAYIDPSFEDNARLMDAVIFASGGGHIEIGERHGMLADPYFPKYKSMSPELTDVMQRYYAFMVRYQDVIGPRTEDASQEVNGNIVMESVSTDPRLQKNKVWPIARKGEDFLSVSFINLLDVKSPEWAKAVENPPMRLENTSVRITGLDRNVRTVWFATPDREDISAMVLPFVSFEDENGHGVSFQIPSLTYWDVVVFEWGE